MLCYQKFNTWSVRAQQKEAAGTTRTAYKEKSKDTARVWWVAAGREDNTFSQEKKPKMGRETKKWDGQKQDWRQYRAEAGMKLRGWSEEVEKWVMEKPVQHGQCWEGLQPEVSTVQSMQVSWWQRDNPEKRYPIPQVTSKENEGKSAKGLMVHQIYFAHSCSRLK